MQARQQAQPQLQNEGSQVPCPLPAAQLLRSTLRSRLQTHQQASSSFHDGTACMGIAWAGSVPVVMQQSLHSGSAG